MLHITKSIKVREIDSIGINVYGALNPSNCLSVVKLPTLLVFI